MGWTWENANISNQKMKDEAVRDMLECSGDGFSYKVIALSRRGSVYYAAVHYKYEERNIDRIYAEVVLTQVNSKDYWNFGHKEMSESMGPCYYECPKKILDMLSPANTDTAQEWREQCRKFAEKRKEGRADITKLKKLQNGTYIKVKWNGETFLQVFDRPNGQRWYVDWASRRRMTETMVSRCGWEVVKK